MKYLILIFCAVAFSAHAQTNAIDVTFITSAPGKTGTLEQTFDQIPAGLQIGDTLVLCRNRTCLLDSCPMVSGWEFQGVIKNGKVLASGASLAEIAQWTFFGYKHERCFCIAKITAIRSIDDSDELFRSEFINQTGR
jgi:hypothetical protein